MVEKGVKIELQWSLKWIPNHINARKARDCLFERFFVKLNRKVGACKLIKIMEFPRTFIKNKAFAIYAPASDDHKKTLKTYKNPFF